ncbi:hypothetical protein PLICRDRAFT_64202, partial [Plicaturopsis crispa FD-325 SS-3]
ARNDLTIHATDICDDLHDRFQPTRSPVFSWALGIASKAFRQDVVELTGAKHGLHFNAGKATSEYLEGSFIQMEDAVVEGMHSNDSEMDLGEFGGHELDDGGETEDEDMAASEDEGDPDTEGGREKKKKSWKRAAARNTALLTIKSVVVISIFLQSTNERCNWIQSVLGIFLHSTSAPEKVVETLAHAGLSISLRSIHRAITSLSMQANEKIKATVRTLTTALAYDNFDITFKTAQPTIEHQSTFVSATSATAIPLFGVDDPAVLRCSDDL